MKTSHIVYLEDTGVDVGAEVSLIATSDDPTTLFFKHNGPFMIKKEQLLEALKVLETHLNLEKPIQYLVPAGTEVIDLSSLESGTIHQIK